jgi:radical SAM-linked protein
MAARPQPASPAPLPAVQRLSIRYAKRSRMRFASHRDVARAVERGVRKAGLPVAYSAGFSPHPKISYAGGAPTGAASEAEYLEISLTASLEPKDVRERLDAALPDGIDVIEVIDLAQVPSAPALEISHWKVVLPGVALADAARAVEDFLAAPSAEVERLTSKGVRRLDARAAVQTMEIDRRAAQERDAGCVTLRMVVRHMTPAVRPDDILVAIRRASALAPSSPPLVTRLWQGPERGAGAAAGARAPGDSGPAEPVADPARPRGGPADREQVKAASLAAEGAGEDRAAQQAAYEQLPRGAEQPAMAASAREPDGRDRPHARERAREQGTT